MLVTSDWIRIFELPDAIAKAVCPGVWPGAAIEVGLNAAVAPEGTPEYFAQVEQRRGRRWLFGSGFFAAQ